MRTRLIRCSMCGTPRHIYRQIIWRDNGTVCQRRNPDHRSVFIESENIDGVFRGIEEIIGLPIEHIVIESRSRSAADYLEHILPAAAKPLLRLIGLKPVIRQMGRMIKALGYGDLELVEMKIKGREDDYLTLRIRGPYSLPMVRGDIAGAVQVFDGRYFSTTVRQTAPTEYELTGRVDENPPDLRERLAWRIYNYKEENIELERCPSCGVPKAFSQFEYDIEKGIIRSKATGRRLVGIGPAALEAIFDELEREIGDTIPQVVIDAQRRFVTGGFYSPDEMWGERDMRVEFAIRGLGVLREMEFRRERLRYRVENPCLHLMIVGLMQGFYELAFGQPSEVDWRLKQDGDLLVVVSPKAS